MPYQQGDPIEELPPFEEPVSVISVDIFRDGGSVEVVLSDARTRLIELWFDRAGGRLGRIYLQVTATRSRFPVTQNSQAERDVVRLLHQHLDTHYSVEERQRLTALDGRLGFRGISQHDHEGYLLLRCLEQIEELRKQVVFGIEDV